MWGLELDYGPSRVVALAPDQARYHRGSAVGDRRSSRGLTMAQSAMRVGDVGPQVRAVRERLVATGDLPGSAAQDETFDTEVERAVRAFQQRRGMLVDGVVG